jgi:hypothetical protein
MSDVHHERCSAITMTPPTPAAMAIANQEDACPMTTVRMSPPAAPTDEPAVEDGRPRPQGLRSDDSHSETRRTEDTSPWRENPTESARPKS